MADLQIIAHDTTQPLLSELRRELPRIADRLKCHTQELAVFDYDHISKDYMFSDQRDQIVDAIGPLPDMPPVQLKRLQAIGNVGFGTYFYRCRAESELTYAVYTGRLPSGWSESFLVIQKDKLFRFMRNVVRLNRECGRIRETPVLADGLLEEIVSNTVGFLRRSKEIEKYGVKIKRGIILDGSPGNGKTMVCRYIQKLCTQHNLSWGVVTSSDIDEAYKEKRMNELFSRHQVAFFDDIDVGYLDRSRGNGPMACTLLTAMDGIYEAGHCVRIFTTNEKVEGLDGAFTRPGRIDKIITLEKPDAPMRQKLVTNHWPKEIQENISVETLVEHTEGYSFAEVEAIRTYLVTNKILGDGTWDLNRAFDEFETRKSEKKFKLGFGKVKTGKKSNRSAAPAPEGLPEQNAGTPSRSG